MQSHLSELQAFLYAPIGDDANGVPLSVLSALARQNIDPWERADDWSRLPRTSALLQLTELISALPPGPVAGAPEAIAARLVVLLPNQHRPPAGAPLAASRSAPTSELPPRPVIAKPMQILIFCVLLGLLGQWLFAEFESSAGPRDAQAPHSSSAKTPGSGP